MRLHYDFSRGRRNPYGRLLAPARLPRRLAQALRRGALVEREHTRDARTARIIASHHLAEDPRYYEKLALMERNPSYRVMSYAAAHAWEQQAAARGVSAVARSGRGFMRAYQQAGSWAKLHPWWKRRREGFLARHIAQAMRGERIWERTRTGVWRPTRRSLAMIMWAFMPPRKPAGCRPGAW